MDKQRREFGPRALTRETCNRRSPMRHSQSGFTLIELANVMTVMTVMTILLGFGVPAFGRYMDDLALQGTAQRIASTLQMTRGGAVATNSSRTVVFEAGHSGTD